MEDNIHTIVDEIYNNIEITTQEDTASDSQSESKDLDTSWIHENERLYKISENVIREPMDIVPITCIYINRNMYIDKIIHKKQNLIKNDRGAVLTKEALLQIIQENKLKTPFSKYKLEDILLYLVNLEPENIQSYSKNENVDGGSKNFLSVLSIMNDVEFEDSIFIFHNINTIYFIFQEIESINHRHTLKSILKPSTNFTEVKPKDLLLNKSKKVRMNLSFKDIKQIYRSRKTRKQYL